MESDEKTQPKLDECVGGGGTNPKEQGSAREELMASEDSDATEASVVARAVAYLRSNPLDYAGCAKHIGLSFYLMRKLRKEHTEEFENEEQRYFSELEKLVALDALGRELPPGYEGFEFSKAMKVLERRKREWAASQKQLAPDEPKIDHSYKDLLKEHLEREFGSKSAKPIRSGNA